LFSLRFELSSIRGVQVIAGSPGSARRVWRKRKHRKRQENFPRGWWPQLVGEKSRSSSSSHRLPHAVKACRRSTFAGRVASTRRVNAVASVSRTPTSIYRRTTVPAPHSPRSLSPKSSAISNEPAAIKQWRTTVRPTMASAAALSTNGRDGSSTARATRRHRTSARREDGD
jgi:hypothetical protein